MNDGEDAAEPPDVPDADDRPDGSADAGSGNGDQAREWRFTLEDIEAREAETAAVEAAQKRRTEPIESGDPSLEGAVFVLLGVGFALFVISRLFVG